MKDVLQKADGKKTYVFAGLLATFAITGMVIGEIEPTTGIQYLLEAGAIVGLRLGIAKIGK